MRRKNNMIFGIGTDLIEVERVENSYKKEAFRNKIYTKQEQNLIDGKAQRAAGNFAVKEAVVKAFGTGFGKIAPIEIEVLREKSGKPYVVLYGEAKKMQQEVQVIKIHVSISNIKEYATAYVVMECENNG